MNDIAKGGVLTQLRYYLAHSESLGKVVIDSSETRERLEKSYQGLAYNLSFNNGDKDAEINALMSECITSLGRLRDKINLKSCGE